MLYIIVLLVVVLFWLFYINTNEEFGNREQIIKKIPKKYKIMRDNCFDLCDKKSCLKMLDMQKNLDKCRECNKISKCYNKNIITPTCDLCFNKSDKMDCLSTLNNGYGCTNPNNIFDFEGVDPYYILVEANDVNYAYNQKCKFCWNI